jgi:Glycosyltransferase family 87
MSILLAPLHDPTDKPNKAGLDRTWPFFAIATVLLFWYSTHADTVLLAADGKSYDLESFWVSGWAANHHLNPYAVYPSQWHFKPIPNGPEIYDVNLSPPCLLPLFQLLAIFPQRAIVIPWTFVSTLLFVSGTALLWIARRGEMQARQILWLLLSSSVIDTLWLGQDYGLMFLLACAVWLLISSERMAAAGICMGILIAMKPNLGLWPILLFVAGYKRPAVLSALSAAAISILAAVIYGPEIYRQWLQAYPLEPRHIFTSDISFVGIFTRLGLPAIGAALAVVWSLSLLLFVRRARPGLVDICGLALCTGILCSPLGWHYYVLFLAPFFVARRWNRFETIAAVLVALPVLFEALVMGHSRAGEFLVSLPHLTGLLMITASFLGLAKPNVR